MQIMSEEAPPPYRESPCLIRAVFGIKGTALLFVMKGMAVFL